MNEELNESKNEEQKQKNAALRKEVISWIKMIVLAIGIAFVLRTYVFQLAYVKGPSMEPTLHEGEILIISKIDYLATNPQRGQIVVLNDYLEGKDLIKRVIGLPGEKVEIKDEQIYINGNVLEPDYEGSPTQDFGFQGAEVPQNHYFVLGDNRMQSRDSRSNTLGFVERKKIKGHGVFRLWPLDVFGTLD